MGAKPEFFCVFMPHINGARMRVCDAFLATLSDELIPERAVLRNCLREAFAVKVCKENGGVYFGEGWREFVAWNGLELGYFLVFRYDGEGGFDVKIFDHSGCEKYLFEDGKEGGDQIKGVDNGRDEAADRDEEEGSDEVDGSDEDEEGEDESKSDDSAADLSASTYRGTSEAGTSTNAKKKIDIHHKRDTPKQQAKVRVRNLAPKPRKTSGSRLGEHRRELRDNAVALVRPQNPYFVVVMEGRNVSASLRSVYVPRSFAKEHLDKFSVQATLLDSEKRKWPVKVRYSTRPCEKWVISLGWSKFADMMKLRVEDTCVFELVKSNPLVLKVSISRADKPETNPPNGSKHAGHKREQKLG